jgi:hypothetical protein
VALSSSPETDAVELVREWCWLRGVRLSPGLFPPPLNSAAAARVGCRSAVGEGLHHSRVSNWLDGIYWLSSSGVLPAMTPK